MESLCATTRPWHSLALRPERAQVRAPCSWLLGWSVRQATPGRLLILTTALYFLRSISR